MNADLQRGPEIYAIIHTSDADLSAVALAKVETYRPIAEIVEELKVIELEAKETDKALGKILKQPGI